MREFRKGRYRARLARDRHDLAACLALRSEVFRAGQDPDEDAWDETCAHVVVEELTTGRLLCCFRMLAFGSGQGIAKSYSAQFYDLSRLTGYGGAMLEMGRFCVRPGLRDPDILRVAWAAMTAHVDAAGIAFLFGCASFQGTDGAAFSESFALLNARHQAPEAWRPGVKSPAIHPFAPALEIDERRARAALPPLLRSYLAMGGWVSDHAVVDAELGTLHVFCAVEVGRVPAPRARLLRAQAQ